MSNKNKQIVIISQSHLCRNPRVYKEAVTLSGAGYDITLITSIYSDELLKEDNELIRGKAIKYLFAADLRSNSFKNYFVRLIRLVSVKLVKWLNLQLPTALGYNLWGYYRLINNINADVFIAHQELPLYLG